MHVWKKYLVADDFLFQWEFGPRSNFSETYWDTDGWDLAFEGIWMKEREVDGIHSFRISYGGWDTYDAPTLERAKEILKSLGINSTDSIRAQGRALVMRVSASIGDNAEVRYDVAEYPDGDIYTVASMVSENKETIENLVKGVPAGCKEVEYLRRYHRDVFRRLVDDNVIIECSAEFNAYDLICGNHPLSVVNMNDWTYEKAQMALARQKGLSWKEYDELEKKYNDAILW